MGRSALFLLPARESPSSRFRVLQYLPRLQADGWTVRVSACTPSAEPPVKDGMLRGMMHGLGTLVRVHNRLRAALRVTAYDMIFIERELLPPFTPSTEELVRLLNRNIVFDFDDSLFLRYSDQAVNPVALVAKMARTVIAANEFLGEWALRHNDNVWVLPTPVDTDRFTPDRVLGDGRLLVWTGISANLPALELVRPALSTLARKYRDLRLRIVCDRPPAFELGIPVEYVRWSPAVEVEAVRSADIGIMPLPDNDWTNGKAGYKVLQYMACGLPPIAAPYGVMSDVIDAGKCGLPAQDTDEWIEALDLFIGNAEMRASVGAAARKRAEDIYSVNALYPRWREVLELMVEQKDPMAV
ncbi:MAG: glycosyltransferase family 4 protein [Planctomycetes bacterium]|nr:glycosyltransferase family 4 protein [Planctomycetota bacterium]